MSTRRKTSRSKERTNNKLYPHMTPGPIIEPGPHWWEVSAVTTTPPLLPAIILEKKINQEGPHQKASLGLMTAAFRK